MSAHTNWLICLQVLLSTCLLASALAHVDYTGHQLIRTRFDRSLDIYFENLLHTTSQTRDGRTGRGTSGTPTGGRRWFLAWAGSRKGCWYYKLWNIERCPELPHNGVTGSIKWYVTKGREMKTLSLLPSLQLVYWWRLEAKKGKNR